MTDLERNSDIVFAASYAPLLQVSASRIGLKSVLEGCVTKLETPSSMSTHRSGYVIDMRTVTYRGFKLTSLLPRAPT